MYGHRFTRTVEGTTIEQLQVEFYEKIENPWRYRNVSESVTDFFTRHRIAF